MPHNALAALRARTHTARRTTLDISWMVVPVRDRAAGCVAAPHLVDAVDGLNASLQSFYKSLF